MNSTLSEVRPATSTEVPDDFAEHFLRIAESAPGVICAFRLRPDGRCSYPYASSGIRKIYGVSAADLAHDAVVAFERVHPDDLPRLRASIAESMRDLSEWHQEYRVLNPLTGEIWVEGRSTPERESDGSVLWRGFLNDITDRKRTEDSLRTKENELRRSEARYRALAEGAHDNIFIIGLDGRYQFLNETAAAMLNKRPEELIGSPVRGSMPPEAAALVEENIRQVRESGTALYVEQPMRFPRGETWQSAWLVPLLDDERQVTAVMGISRDITERRQLATLLERQNSLLSAIVDSSSIGIAVLDGPSLVCDMVNPALQGFMPERAIAGVSFLDIWPGDVSCMSQMFARVLATGIPGECVDVPYGPALSKGKLPSTATVAASLLRTPGSASPGLLILVTETTSRKQLEAEFFQAQKMEAVGRLAGGIAHDFNNLLTSILGFAELLRDSLAPDDRRRSDLDEIRRAGESAATLTRQLLTFSRRQIVEPAVLDPNTVIRNFDRILRRTIGEDVALSLRLAPDLGRIIIDAGQLEQIVMNLSVNARDAMPRGGSLTLETANVELARAEHVMQQSIPAGEYVTLSVTDTGTGMTREVLSHLFEPFFTTKEFGKGTGLGLSTVFGIVKQHGGYIDVASEPQRGTTFTIYFHKSTQLDVEAVAAPTQAPQRASGETILIAEDNTGLRALASKTLQSCGYRTLVAQDAREAMQLSRDFDGTIALLLTDVVMPGPDGVELARELAERRPETRVLYMSGYTDDVMARHAPSIWQRAFLQKPFTRDTLTHKVREVLDARIAQERM